MRAALQCHNAHLRRGRSYWFSRLILRMARNGTSVGHAANGPEAPSVPGMVEALALVCHVMGVIGL